jgi:catechol 2,3-dioxygenase-like lactoylglutathione lyase family enzyme
MMLGSVALAADPAPADNGLHLQPPRTISLTVANLDREVDWYVKVLGGRETMRHHETPLEELRRVEIAGYRVDLIWHQGSSRPTPQQYQEGYDHISFQSTDLEADFKWLGAHGIQVEPIRDPKTNAMRRMVFHDPEGNEIRIEPVG